MSITIHICTGPQAAEDRLDQWVADHRPAAPAAPLQRLNILVASGLQRRYHQRRLAKNAAGPDTPGAHAAIYFFTPTDLAKEIAARSDAPPRQALPAGADVLLMEDLLDQLDSADAGDRLRRLDPRSPGLAGALAVTLTDLREGNVPPDEFADFAAQRNAPVLGDLARIYRQWMNRIAGLGDRTASYEDALSPHATDAHVRDALGGAPLAVVGMYDLTHVQRSLIQRCADVAEVDMIVPAPPGAGYVRGVIGAFAEECGIEPNEDDSPVSRVQPGGFSAADPNAEAAEVARRVLDAAHDGIKFNEMAILHRSGAAADARIMDALKRADIPCFTSGGTPVLQTAAGRAALNLIELLGDAPQRPRLLDLLGSPALRGRLRSVCRRRSEPDPDAADDDPIRPKPLQWERISRRAGLSREWPRFEARLASFIDDSRNEASDEAITYQLDAAKELFDVCADLRERAEALQRAPGWEEASEIVKEAFHAYIRDGGDDGERRIIDAIVGVLEDLSALARAGIEYSAPRLRSAAQRALDRAGTRDPRDLNGVLIVNAGGAARTLQFDAVFIAGAAERAIPAVPRQDPLLHDADRRALNQFLGAEALRLHRARPEHDRFIFALARSAARGRFTASYARRTSAIGSPAHPSALLLAAFGEPDRPLLSERELEDHPDFTRLIASVSGAAPTGEQAGAGEWEPAHRALDEADLRLAALSPAAVDAVNLLFDVWPEGAPRADRARRSRANTAEFTEYDGLIAVDPEKWNPFAADMTFAPTALERYAACPYRFFLSKVLGVRAVSEPGESLELAPLDRGDIMHRIFEQWVLAWIEREDHSVGWPEYARDGGKLRELAEPILDRAQEDRKLGGPNVAPAVRGEILEDLEMARAHESARSGDGWHPIAVEHPIDDIRIDAGGGREILVKGRIDRVDAGPGNARRAIDYKTGKPAEEGALGFASGKALQLPLYLHGLRQQTEHQADLEASTAELAYITRRGGFARHELPGLPFARDGTPAAPTYADMLREVVETLTSGMQEGRFFPFPFKKEPTASAGPHDLLCTYCDYQYACPPRVSDRIFQKGRRSHQVTAEFGRMRQRKADE